MAALAGAMGVAGLRTGAELERALEERRRRPPLRTGLGALDRLQGGGLPRGALIELSGRRSSGRLALALAALAAATAAGEPAALVDPSEQLDPEGARAAGVELERLLWARPRGAREAAACAGALLDAGFALVVLDLGELAAPPRLPGASWLRLARAARAQDSILLLVSSRPLAGTAADVFVAAEKTKTLWDRGPAQLNAPLEAPASEENGRRPGAWPPLLSGVASRLSVRSRRGLGAPLGSDTLSLLGPAAAAVTDEYTSFSAGWFSNVFSLRMPVRA